MVHTSGLPVPFYKVVKEELNLLRPNSNVLAEDSSNPSTWIVTASQVSDWDGLRVRWDLLKLEDLSREARGETSHRFRSYMKDLADSCSEAVPKAKPAIQRLGKFFASDKPYASSAQVTGELQPRETLLRKMESLVLAKKCICHYETFPKGHLGDSMRKLVNSFCAEQPSPEVQELNRLILEDLFPDQLQKIYELELLTARKEASAAGLSALCLSGGGIRSATFCLGILQGLARRGVLKEFDYLSTVSGGGYIGSWLSAWLHHSGADPTQVFEELNLKQPNSRVPVEPKQIVHLRRYSNYLSPHMGLLSADTWVLIGTYLRNLLLNWIVFGPFLLAACAIPRLCVAFLGTRPTVGLMTGFLWSGLLLAILGLAYASAAHPGAEGRQSKLEEPEPPGREEGQPGGTSSKRHGKHVKELIRLQGQGSFFIWCLAPIYVSAGLLTTFWFWFYTRGTGFKSILIFSPDAAGPDLLNYLLLGTTVTLLGWVFAQLWLFFRTKAILSPHPPGVEVGTGIVAGLLLYLAAHLAFPWVMEPGPLAKEMRVIYAALAPTAFLLIFLVAGTLFVGFSSRWSSDEDREWWARMGGWILVVAVAWTALCAWILFGPLLFFKAAAFLTSVGGISGLVTLVLAHSGLTAANLKGQQKTGQTGKVSNYCLALAAPVFLASILAALSMLAGWLIYLFATANFSNSSLYHVLMGRAKFSGVEPWTQPGYLAIIEGARRHLCVNFILLMLAVGGTVSLLVNINRFSLHAIYRNRLVRAYLGASNPKRKPNLFTGFDPEDNFGLGRLRQKAGASPNQRPLHIINMALNLVGGKELAWQQRKAETFTASKLFTGNLRLGFRRTDRYASSEMNRGLTLGTAMAISGAAANPNMGYHSSPVVAFLMTLFNIRLGCWLGNPGPGGQSTYQISAPVMPVWYAAKEAFGLSDDTSGFVCLSDGGHFENLGLYEMIQRRCKSIVVCDAGCDPACSLDDLGNAIRKIRADLGVRIIMKNFNIYSRYDRRYETADQPEIGRYCAVGDIYYDAHSEIPDATLIYLKPAICGREPKDVFNYKEVNRAFPHESTGDQFFSESQFESYRALGVWIIDRIHESVPPPAKEGLESFMAFAAAYAHGDTQPGVENPISHCS
jgi:hypothetical protein